MVSDPMNSDSPDGCRFDVNIRAFLGSLQDISAVRTRMRSRRRPEGRRPLLACSALVVESTTFSAGHAIFSLRSIANSPKASIRSI